ncbi:MAG TPA: tetratricopeptide repeat protein, partial [Steroidobacteraceae bacterium]|nr:tetratricopeptide repeat protein [Steroidobacteraceae bacterium]
QERDKATQESERAETVSNFMLDVFTAADPFQSQDKQITAKELLDKAANKIETNLNDQPEVKARLLEAIGEAYLNQGQSQSAIQYLNQALQIQHDSSTPDERNINLISYMNVLSRAYIDQNDFDNANRILEQARDEFKRTRETFSPEYMQTLINSGLLEAKTSHPLIAQKYYEDALESARQVYGNNHVEIADILMSLAQTMIWQSRYAEAEPLVKEAQSIYRLKLPEKHPERLSADLSLCEILHHLGHDGDALKLANKVLLDQRAVFGENSSQLINTYNILSQIYLTTSRYRDAEQMAKQGLDIARHSLGNNNFMTGQMQSSVANVSIRRKEYAAAEHEASLSFKVLQSTASPNHQYIASAEYLLASALAGEYKSKEAEPMIRENMARWSRAEAPAWRSARSESLLGVALLQLHKPGEAKQHLLHADEILSAKDSGAIPDDIAIAHKRVEEFKRCEEKHQLSNCVLSIS